MKQILHIFAKDARRFWPEIAISLAITLAFAIVYPKQWPGNEPHRQVFGANFYLQQMTMLGTLLALLVPISWLLLIGRVIHAESLVGDRQFWLTRPYEWKKLLAAKALFLVVFLYLPIFLAHCALLLQAGYSPLHYLPGLLYNLLLITGFLVLPLFALSAVTSSFVRIALIILAILLGSIALSVGFMQPGGISFAGHISLPLVVVTCLAAMSLQYARRRVWIARALLLGCALLLFLIPALLSDNAQMDRDYPRAGSPQSSVRLSFAHDADHQPAAQAAGSPKQVAILLPLEISGIADGHVWTPDDVKATIEAPQQKAWQSPWQSIGYYHLFPGTQEFNISFNTDRAYYDRIRSTPVTLHLTFAVTDLESGQVRRVALPTHDFSVPNFGICTPLSFDVLPPEFLNIGCRFAMRPPHLTYVEGRWSEGPCQCTTTLQEGIKGDAWTGTLDNAPAEFGITSVWTPAIILSNGSRETPRNSPPPPPRHLCPGTPLTFTEYHVSNRTQFELTIPNFHLPAYNASGPSSATFEIRAK